VSTSTTNGTALSNDTGRYQRDKVRVAIIGVGNCANSFIQGVEFYKNADATQSVPGLMHVDLGGYHVNDIEFTAAFDVNAGIAALAAVSSLLVSYTRARAEGLGLDGKAGVGSRAVRVVILSIGLVLGGNEIVDGLDLLDPAIWVLAALGVFTTAQRMWHVRSQLNAPGA
jgi:hypothetical protein